MSDLTATVQDTWPPRVALAASGVGTIVTINRVANGVSTPVRGANERIVSGGALVVIDAEMPFGVPVSYTLIDDSVLTDTVAPQTFTLVGGKVALTDAITGLAAEVAIVAADERSREAPSTVFNIDGKNRVVSGRVGQYRTTVEYFCETASGNAALAALLTNATQGIILQRAPDVLKYDGTDDYLAVLGADDRRFSQDGSDERRIWSVRVAQCDGWSTELEARGFTLQDVADAYTGLTLADLAADYATLLALASGDYS